MNIPNHSNTRPSRRVRSRNGCLTCRRRKVACNEQRPRCGHCERLGLQCSWRPLAAAAAVTESRSVPTDSEGSGHMSAPGDVTAALLNGWDFNNVIWNDTPDIDASALGWLSDDTPHQATNSSLQADGTQSWISQTNGTSGVDLLSPTSLPGSGTYALLDRFLASPSPPILSTIEVGPRWNSTKILLAFLAGTSEMVRDAIMAFSALELRECETVESTASSVHAELYRKAADQLAAHIDSAKQNAGVKATGLQDALAATFFLAYSDLVTNQVDRAQVVLMNASTLVKSYSQHGFTSSERRLISWVRLVDGRASSAGGDGVFLNETDQTTLSSDKATVSSMEPTGDTDGEIQELLFDMLYAPGLEFYQKVQSIMARVSRIDPWHRTRGTVSDETEVMAIAAKIQQDLVDLEAQRPSLMDYAVGGTLTEKHLSKEISSAITRSYRTSRANLEAGFIHLHRVAYKHLPPTEEVTRARTTIKQIARLFEAAKEPLPVNYIWPLLMACCEEDDMQERMWIIQAIRDMQSLVSNAKPIASVLEEVHRRQDATNQRADVRQTSMDLFNMSFAAV